MGGYEKKSAGPLKDTGTLAGPQGTTEWFFISTLKLRNLPKF